MDWIVPVGWRGEEGTAGGGMILQRNALVPNNRANLFDVIHQLCDERTPARADVLDGEASGDLSPKLDDGKATAWVWVCANDRPWRGSTVLLLLVDEMKVVITGYGSECEEWRGVSIGGYWRIIRVGTVRVRLSGRRLVLVSAVVSL